MAKSICYYENNSPLEKQVAVNVLPVQRELYEVNKTLYGAGNEVTLMSLQSLALIAQNAGSYDSSINYYKILLDLTEEIHGRFSPEALNVLEGLGFVYFEAGRSGLATSTRIKLIQDARTAYGPNSMEYKQVLLKNVGLSRLSDTQQAFIDQELKRVKSLSDKAVGSAKISDISQSEMVELLLRLDVNKWTIKQYQACTDLLLKATKPDLGYVFIESHDAIILSKKYVEVGKILHGENSFNHVNSLDFAAFVVSRFDQSIAIELYDQLLKLSEKVFFESPGRLSNIYLKAMFFGQRLGLNDASQYLAQKYLESRFSYYKTVLPFINSEDRLSEMESDSFPFDSIYTSALNAELSADTAAFAIINRHGILGELEKQYSRLGAYDNESQVIYSKLSALNSELSRAELTPRVRANLSKQRLDLELILSEKYGFSPEVIQLSEIKKNIPSNAVLLQTRLIDNISLDGDSREYIAVLVFPDGDSKIVRIGSAAQISLLVSQLYAKLQNGGLDYEQVARNLREIIFSPVEAYIRKKDLFFVPDGVLNLLPLGLSELRIEGVGRISVLSAARDLIKNDNLKSKASEPIVVANPDYGVMVPGQQSADFSESLAIARSNIESSRSLANATWYQLPATRKEGNALHSILGGTYFYGSNATKKAIIKNT